MEEVKMLENIISEVLINDEVINLTELQVDEILFKIERQCLSKTRLESYYSEVAVSSELPVLVLYSRCSASEAKSITALLKNAIYINTKYDKNMDSIRGLRFSKLIVLDVGVSGEYIHHANHRVYKEEK